MNQTIGIILILACCALFACGIVHAGATWWNNHR
jgi:hypothetical protein